MPAADDARSLAIRDQHVLHIRAEIRRRQSLLRRKRRELEEKEGWNEWLKEVRTEYDAHRAALVREKQKQYDALLALKEYVARLADADLAMDRQLRDTQRDQQHLVRELDKVRAEMQALLDDAEGEEEETEGEDTLP